MPVGLTTAKDVASSQSSLDQPQKMTTALPSKSAAGLLLKEPSICPTDEEAQFHRPADVKHGMATGTQKRLDKKSWEYVIKSGVAGGIAGCAVSFFESDVG